MSFNPLENSDLLDASATTVTPDHSATPDHSETPDHSKTPATDDVNKPEPSSSHSKNEQSNKSFFANKKAVAALIGGTVGFGVFAGSLFVAPGLAQAATYAVAGALASVLGASAGVYIGAMIAVGLASTLMAALVAVAVRAAIDHFTGKSVAFDAKQASEQDQNSYSTPSKSSS